MEKTDAIKHIVDAIDTSLNNVAELKKTNAPSEDVKKELGLLKIYRDALEKEMSKKQR